MLSEAAAFAALLRKAGVRVALSEVRDFLQAVTLTGVDRDSLIGAMEAALIKDESQRPALERLFGLFWDRRPAAVCPTKRPMRAGDPPRLKKEQFSERLQGLKDFIRNEKQRLSEEACGCCSAAAAGGGTGRPGAGSPPAEIPDPGRFASAILDGNPEKMRSLAKTALEGLPLDDLDDRELNRQLRLSTGWAGGEEMLLNMARVGAVRDWWALAERIELFGSILAGERDRLIWENNRDRVLSGLNTAEASFNSLDYLQSREIRRKLVMLGRRLAAKRGYRYAASPGGKVDMRRTAALAGRLGGVPIKLLMRRRKPEKPEIVILCDLSGSVSSFSRFMLLLVSAMQDKFRSVRSFAFVDAIEEITPMLKGWDAEKKIAEILRMTRIWQTGFSDYGAVWKQFDSSCPDVIGGRATLIILGDARNNYKPDGMDHFARIAGSARRVLWLNPAPAAEWNREDSIIGLYGKHCSAVLECRNLEQLEKVVRHVFN